MPEMLDLPVRDVLPGDLLGEQGRVREVVWTSWDGYSLVVGPCWAEEISWYDESNALEPTTIQMPRWGELQEIPSNHGQPIRVIRDAPLPPLPVQPV